MRAALRAALSLLAIAGPLSAEPAPVANPFGRVYPPRIYTTARLVSAPPVIDGRLDDACWREGEWAGDYRQQIPKEGAAPSQPTELKILYDEQNVYVAIRAYDDPAQIHRLAGRRDAMIGDVVGVTFDSYFDKRTGFEFDLTAAGGKIDLILMNDDFDTSWDAVWQGKTGMEANAWTAEFAIPLSQLRYGPQEEQVWGLHAWRWIDRLQEEDQWNLIPRQSTGRMYNLGELHGIRGLKRFRHIELLPYGSAKALSEPGDARDPYRQGLRGLGSAGLDAKVGLTTDITLDATINPDFGQVEADPSVMNLSAYETFLQERRPFFLEGRSILDFDAPDGELFYSRRIGHAPSHTPGLRDGEFMRAPDHTAILGALKVSGKTRDGLSLAIVESVTAPESARLSYLGQERRVRVEPTTNYFLGRVQKDWGKGNTILGGVVTSTHRWLGADAAEEVAADAVTGGVDFARYFRNRTYALSAKAIFSRVSGERAAITELQRNAVHYFQRPDDHRLRVDETATALAGHGGELRFERAGTSRWRASETLQWSSPGLELNDLGFLSRADLARSLFNLSFQEPKPGRVLREFHVHLDRTDAWEFGGRRTDTTTTLTNHGQFTNKWGYSVRGTVVQDSMDTRQLRGGPSLRKSSFFCGGVDADTDYSRPLAAGLSVHQHVFPGKRSGLLEFYPRATIRLSNAVSLSTDLGFSHNRDDLQYVATIDSGAGTGYLLGEVDQRTLSATLRLNVQVTPELSIQLYASPFVSAGRYSDFKRVTTPMAEVYEDRFHRIAAGEIAHDPSADAYRVREGTGGMAYAFDNPDFSFRQFRSNAVLRWELRPGTALYAVWSQGRTSDSGVWEESLQKNYDALWRAPAANVFLVKLSYWLPM